MAHFRIDFGRVVPGLLILLAGFVLLAFLIVVAIVAFFFSFEPLGGTILTVSLQLMLLPAILVAAGLITMFTGVSWWGRGGSGFFSGVGWSQARKDQMRLSARVGEVVGVAIAFIVFLFLYTNQVRGVAFFTSGFGPEAQFFFYAPLFTGMALSIGRAAYGHRNGLRPYQALNLLFLSVSAFWLLSAFPFNFAHFADMFPNAIQFVFGWLTNDIGRLLFLLAGLFSLVGCAYNAFMYPVVRAQLHMQARPDINW